MKIINRLFFIIIAGIVFASCDEAIDEITKPTVVILVPDIPVINYGDTSSYIIELALDKPHTADITVDISVSGDAIDTVDYILSPTPVILPANKTGIVPLVLKVLGDAIRKEVTRNLTITVGSGVTENANITPVDIDVVFNETPDSIYLPVPIVEIKYNFYFAHSDLSDLSVCDYEIQYTLTVQPPVLPGEDDEFNPLLDISENPPLGDIRSCPERTIILSTTKLTEGVKYDVWISFSGTNDGGASIPGYTDPLTGYVELKTNFSRKNTEFAHEVIQAKMHIIVPASSWKQWIIERNGDVITLSDITGEVLEEG